MSQKYLLILLSASVLLSEIILRELQSAGSAGEFYTPRA
jgi:hypothetical protein